MAESIAISGQPKFEAVVHGDVGECVTSSIGSPIGRRLLAPLLPRYEAIQLITRCPTLLHRNVSTSLAPKLRFLREVMGESLVMEGGNELASAADELVRNFPRLLLSSFGVYGRVKFLICELANKVNDELVHGRSSGSAVSSEAVRAAIMAPRIAFFTSHKTYRQYLTNQLVESVVKPVSMDMSSWSTDRLESAHGSLIRLRYTSACLSDDYEFTEE
jgi:hypothetical protein